MRLGALVPRGATYVLGALAAVKALGLVLLAEAVARGVASLAAGDTAWRDALVLGVGAALLRAGAAWATQAAAARAAIGTKERVRAQLADALLGGAPRVGSSAALASRELDALDDFFTAVLPAITSVAVIPLLIGARILLADWVSALIIVLTVPLIPVFMILVGKYTQERTDAATAALDRLSDHVVELARGLPVLVGLGRVREQAEALDRISDDYRRTTMATLRVAFLSALVLELIATLSVAVVAVFIGIRMLGGDLTLATGLLALILAPECFAPFRELGSAFHASRSGLAALESAQAVIDAPPRRTLPRTAGDPAVRGLTIAFDGREPIVEGLTVTLPVRGVVALTGASGSGKSTVLRALAGRLDASATGWVQGIDPSRVAWAPQHPRTVGATVRDELATYADNEFAVEWMLGRLGLLGVADADPVQVSLGELRRIAVARAMLRVDSGADVVLLDEPTAHLDDASAAAVVSLIRWAGERATVVVASHDESVVGLAGQRIALDATGGAGRVRSPEAAATGPEIRRDGRVRAPAPAAASAERRFASSVGALAAFVRPALGRYLAAILLGTLAAGFAVALTAVSAWLIVRASEMPAIMYLLVAIVGVRFFGIGRAVLRYSERLVTHDAVFRSTGRLRSRLWSALAAQGPSSRALQNGGTALDYLVGAADDVRDLVPRIVVPAASGVLVSVGAVIATALILPSALVPLGIVLAVALLVAPAASVLADRAAESQRLSERSGILRLFGAALDAADDLRGNGVDSRVRARLAELDEAAARSSRRVALAQGLGAALVLLAGCLGSLGMLSAAATAQLPAALAAVLVLLPIALLEPLLSAVAAIAHWPALTAALAKTAELDLDASPVAPGADPGVTTLAVHDVAAGWPGAPAVFSGVTATVSRGEWLVVDGPSGSGKSTLLSVLLGSLPAVRGSILLDGRVADAGMLASAVAWCPQEAHLFDSTVRANLLLGRPRDDRPSDEELVAALRGAGLGALLESLPEGLDTRIGSRGSRLSGGERQRLAIARTLLSRRSVILLDEPTAHLDEPTAEALLADVRRAFADRIVVLVTHHADDVRADDSRVSLGAAAVAA
ncbi:thiol reductant ABC exporter subunit CydC [Salinibacterium soli]|uniref:Thiol reductant ABC exporter subunit CydC n=1 Tax=Antiquaquibacter soli TaxID=3064523 RepID=A0ABT9BQ79_9MICO|nr:thiol reductant ABC exporter subunit CydC [Protaetiibacter sp. WY-16]MDO7882774.1 thiol reductant ABC exporter subunit CydC [Protaetiibacter sp. WY-16]